MSQPSSPYNPPPSPAETTPRRLISPAERFAPPVEPETAVPDPFVAETPLPSRRDDEMARRHVPPRERQKHERLLKKRQKREATHRVAPVANHSNQHGQRTDQQRTDQQRTDEQRAHEQRAQAEREFTQQARVAPPKAAVKTRRRVPVWIKRLFLLVAVIFVGQLGFAAFTAPQFDIKSVSITGADATPEDQLQPLAAKLVGQNLLRANRAAVESAVEKLPTVASAHIARLPVWPPKVQLRIEERQAVVQVGAGNTWWVIDANGVPFRKAEAQDAGLYQVVAPEFAPQRGRKLEPKAWTRAAALNTALQDDNNLVAAQTADSNSGAAKEPFWQLRRIYFDKDGLASLRLTGKGQLAQHDEMLLRLGDDHWAEKLARARVALSYFDKTGRRAQELDLVSLERPVWRPIPAQLAVESHGDSPEKHTG